MLAIERSTYFQKLTGLGADFLGFLCGVGEKARLEMVVGGLKLAVNQTLMST